MICCAQAHAIYFYVKFSCSTSITVLLYNNNNLRILYEFKCFHISSIKTVCEAILQNRRSRNSKKKKTLVQYSPNHLNIFKFQVQCCRYGNLHRYQIWHTIFLFGRPKKKLGIFQVTAVIILIRYLASNLA